MTVPSGSSTGPAAEQSQHALPGTLFYAPRARLLDDVSGQPILVGQRPVHADLISTRVTQTHNGVSQLSLTLNNQRHEAASPYKPQTPTWLYNDFELLSFGQVIRVELAYGEAPWITMIVARITDMSFSFPSAGGSQVTLRGEDMLSLLTIKPEEDKRYGSNSSPPAKEMDMVRDVLTRSAAGFAPPTGPAPFPESLRTLTHQKSQTYLQFIQSLAERMDYEIFIDPEDPSTLHFEPSRSMVLGGLVDLTWNKDLVDFKPTFKGWQVYTKAVGEGRSRSRRAAINELVTADEIDDDLHTAPGGATPINAVTARNQYFVNDNSPDDNKVSISITNLDAARVRAKAIGELRKSAREFLTAEATTLGFTSLKPGMHVNIKQLKAPFDGIYYVTKVVHTLDSNGYKTMCSLRRPGMLEPDLYPAS